MNDKKERYNWHLYLLAAKGYQVQLQIQSQGWKPPVDVDIDEDLVLIEDVQPTVPSEFNGHSMLTLETGEKIALSFPQDTIEIWSPTEKAKRK